MITNTINPAQILIKALNNLPRERVSILHQHNDVTKRGKLLGGKFSPSFVLLHHTAGINSLGLLAKGGPHPPVPGSHYHIDRAGKVTLITIFQCYHAGKGKGFGVPDNLLNLFSVGIEVESLGKVKDFTPEQIESIGALVAGLLDGMGVGLDHFIEHEQWSTTGKVDTRYTPAEFRQWVTDFRKRQVALNGGYATDPKPPAKVPSKPAPKPPVDARYPGKKFGYGARGAHVRTIQRHLGISPTGWFGPKTKAAVVALQRAKSPKLGVADGIVGPMTYAAILKIKAK